MNMIYKHTFCKRGFTLLELVIVISIIGLALPALFSIFFVLARQQIKISQLQKIKASGDTAYHEIINTVRNNAISINDSDCVGSNVDLLTSSAETRIIFSDPYSTIRDEKCFVYYIRENPDPIHAGKYQLASMSGRLDTPVILIGRDDDDLMLEIDLNATPEFTAKGNRLARFKFSVKHIPETTSISPQSLDYQFFIFLRKVPSNH